MTPAEIKHFLAFDWVSFVAEYNIRQVGGPAQNLRHHLNSLLFSGLSIQKLNRLSARKLAEMDQ